MTQIGNKTGGGSTVTATSTSITIDGATTAIDVGDQVSATGTSITINGSTTNLDGQTQAQVQSEIDSRVGAEFLGANAAKLKRVDTDAWEIPQAGVTYYAPNYAQQYTYGSSVKRIYFSTVASGDTLVAASTNLIDARFRVADTTPAPDQKFIANGGISISTKYAYVYQEVGGDNPIKINITGAGWTVTTGYVEYY